MSFPVVLNYLFCQFEWRPESDVVSRTLTNMIASRYKFRPTSKFTRSDILVIQLNMYCKSVFKIKQIIFLLLTPLFMTAQTLVDFKENPTTKHWKVVDDVVMGGRSSGTFTLSEEGYGQFSGTVSLENNGGFSSVKCDFETVTVKPNSVIRIRLKGDGNTYQFRIKDKRRHSYSYITTFKTTGDWQSLEFPLAKLTPTFRGRKVDLPNFDQYTIEELRFLIGNKKPQTFKLLIECILVTNS